MGWNGVERRKSTKVREHWQQERRAVSHVKRRDDDVTPGTWTPSDSGITYGSNDTSSYDSGDSGTTGGGGSFDGGGASGDY